MGRRLGARFLHWCAHKNLDKVSVAVAPANDAAIALYESLGYTRFGIYHDYYEDHGDAIRMQRTVEDVAAEMERLKERERQLEVLMRAVQGKSNKVIARELFIAEGTVKAHLSAAFRALGVSNRTEAVYAASRLKLVKAA